MRMQSERGPRAVVVFESMFGNTEQVARAVGRGLETEGVHVDVLEVNHAPELVPSEVSLLVVGAPTHAFSLSRPSTRTDAVRQGAPAARQLVGIREWLEASDHEGEAPPLAIFDTIVAKVRWLPKAAGRKATKIGQGRGFRLLASPESFLVEDLKGPLLGGELERAEAWGRSLAVELRGHGAEQRGRSA